MRRTKPKSIDRQREKRAAVRSVVLSTLFQLITIGALLYLRSVTASAFLRGVMLLLAVTDLVTIPFTFGALWQRVQELEKGELEEAKKY